MDPPESGGNEFEHIRRAWSRLEDGNHALYQDVMDAMSCQSIIGDFGAIRTRELREPDEQRCQYREQWNRELADAVGEGNFDAASDAARKLLDSSDRRLPPSAFRLTMADSINAVLTAFYEAVSDASQRFALTSQLEKLLAGSTEHSFERDFLQMLSYACSTARAAWERETTGLSTRIQEYVEAHYTDSSLNISAIAEAMGRSPKYISRVFKAETGEGLLDHINLVRVRHAKALLQEKNRTCEELAALVETAVVGLDAGLEHEGHLVTVAEVFRTLQAPATGRIPTILHVELIFLDGVASKICCLVMDIFQAGIDSAVKRHVSGHGRAGKNAENGESGERLFHDVAFT